MPTGGNPLRDSLTSGKLYPHSSQPATAILTIGPTTAFLRWIPNASAEECEALALECFEQKQGGKELELEAIFRRWLTLESPQAILKNVSDFDGQWRSDWNASFFLAWVSLDEKAAMAGIRRCGAARSRKWLPGGVRSKSPNCPCSPYPTNFSATLSPKFPSISARPGSLNSPLTAPLGQGR